MDNEDEIRRLTREVRDARVGFELWAQANVAGKAPDEVLRISEEYNVAKRRLFLAETALHREMNKPPQDARHD